MIQKAKTTIPCGNAFSEDDCGGCLNILIDEDEKVTIYCNECANIHNMTVAEPVTRSEYKVLQHTLYGREI